MRTHEYSDELVERIAMEIWRYSPSHVPNFGYSPSHVPSYGLTRWDFLSHEEQATYRRQAVAVLNILSVPAESASQP